MTLPSAPHSFAVVTSADLPDLHQRVVRVLATGNGSARVKYGNRSFEVSSDSLQPVTNIEFEKGDSVSCDLGPATVRDVIWHFKDRQANYYLEIAGKKASKRYLGGDLAPTSG